jgi:carboxyl-terminal processing protease
VAASLVAAIVVFAGGCENRSRPADEQRSEVAQPAPTSADRADASVETTKECPDWSAQDLSGLPPLPDHPHASLLNTVWQRVLTKHFDPTLGCLDWPDVRTRYAKRLAETSTKAQAIELINHMLEELKQSHFHLYLEHAEDGSEERRIGPAAADIRVRWLDEKLVVTESGVAAIAPGSVVGAIEDKPVDAWIAPLRERAGDDGSLATAVLHASRAWLSCPSTRATKSVTMQSEGKQVRRSIRCTTDEGQRLTMGNLTNVPTHVEHRMLPETAVGYLSFNVWLLPMLPRIEGAISDLRESGMKALIMDLRGNPGGVGVMTIPLARMLLDRKASLGRLALRESTQEFNVEAAEDPFVGPVAILIDEGTASTSEIFAAGMRDIGRATLFGSHPSAGAALPSVIEEIEPGVMLQYVIGDYHSPKGQFVEGTGVVPDKLVPQTRDDYAAQRDPVLQAAIEHVQRSAS